VPSPPQAKIVSQPCATASRACCPASAAESVFCDGGLNSSLPQNRSHPFHNHPEIAASLPRVRIVEERRAAHRGVAGMVSRASPVKNRLTSQLRTPEARTKLVWRGRLARESFYQAPGDIHETIPARNIRPGILSGSIRPA